MDRGNKTFEIFVTAPVRAAEIVPYSHYLSTMFYIHLGSVWLFISLGEVFPLSSYCFVLFASDFMLFVILLRGTSSDDLPNRSISIPHHLLASQHRRDMLSK